ncbi:hypothetical protein ABPG72_014916 [Tetrahymena utriculariae]
MNAILNIVNSFKTPSSEDFEKHGFLTPKQFLDSGDQLTLMGWKWEKVDDNKKLNKNLTDPKKQFLTFQGRSLNRIKKNVFDDLEEKVNSEGFVETSQRQTNSQDNQEQEEEMRIYNFSITYDTYYHVPRIWFSGVDENQKPLKKEQMFEDVMPEYRDETVTLEKHPHLGYDQMTIHPCKHSQILKSFIDQAKENGRVIKPTQALIIFLKFVGSVLPTLEIETTTDLEI